MSYDHEFPALAGVHLEDSFVLDISDTADSLTFSLDAVLRPCHPRYRDPRLGEQYCYRHADLVFENVSRLDWITRTGRSFTDATGEADLGNIDSLTHNGNHYELTGDWGEVHRETPTPPRIQITADE